MHIKTVRTLKILRPFQNRRCADVEEDGSRSVVVGIGLFLPVIVAIRRGMAEEEGREKDKRNKMISQLVTERTVVRGKKKQFLNLF